MKSNKVIGFLVLFLCTVFVCPVSVEAIVVGFEEISPAATANIVICDDGFMSDTGTEWFAFHMNLYVKMLDLQAGFDQEFVPDGGQLEEVYFSWDCGHQELPGKLNFVNTVGSGVPLSPCRERADKGVY